MKKHYWQVLSFLLNPWKVDEIQPRWRCVVYAHIKMKTIPLCSMDCGQTSEGFHPIDSSLKSKEKPSFSLLLVVDFHANS